MSDVPTTDEWAAVRQILKDGLLEGVIPIEGMRPKEVWSKFRADNVAAFTPLDYKIKSVSEKFGRMLRALRKKHKDGDLEYEGEKVIAWGKSAAKQYLKKIFREKLISVDYQDPKQVWDDHCDGHKAFRRMQFDDAFVRRLKTVRDDYAKKAARCESDLQAFLIAKRNHPTPELNSRGEPQWNGSPAQQLLKDIVEKNGHAGIAPQVLWKSKDEFQVYSLRTFRDHIYQEQRLLKFRNYLSLLKKRKLEELQY